MAKVHYAETRFGFEFGALDVRRACSDEKAGWVTVDLTTPKARLQVYVTKTGKVRVFTNAGVEWLPIEAEIGEDDRFEYDGHNMIRRVKV